MIVLGIDPGIANMGFGVVEGRGGRLAALDGGVISPPSGLPLERRLVAIHERLEELVAAHRPEALAIEEVYFGQNVRTALSVGQASGVAMLAAASGGLACFHYTPQAIKSAVCGSGAAGKDQVQRMVQMLLALPEPPAPDHAADALAVAICHLGHLGVRSALENAGQMDPAPAASVAGGAGR